MDFAASPNNVPLLFAAFATTTQIGCQILDQGDEAFGRVGPPSVRLQKKVNRCRSDIAQQFSHEGAIATVNLRVLKSVSEVDNEPTPGELLNVSDQ